MKQLFTNALLAILTVIPSLSALATDRSSLTRWLYTPSSSSFNAEGWSSLASNSSTDVELNGKRWNVATEYQNGVNLAPFVYSYYSAPCIVFGNSYGTRVNKVTMTSDEFDGFTISDLQMQLIMAEGGSIKTSVIYNGNSYDINATNVTSGNYVVAHYLTGTQSVGTVKLDEEPVKGTLSIVIEAGSDINMIYLNSIDIMYDETTKPIVLHDPELKLPNLYAGQYSTPWTSDGFEVRLGENEGTFINEDLIATSDLGSALSLKIEPQFVPDYEPENIDADLKERQKNQDAYYRDDAVAAFSEDFKALKVKVPCSGLYKLTLKYTPAENSTFTASEVTSLLNIYPNEESVEINWNKPDMNSGVVVVNDYIGDGEGFRKAHLNYKTIWNIGYYYKVEGTPLDISMLNTRSESVHPKSTVDPKYTVPEGYTHFNSSIDLTPGNQLKVYRVKNGAVSDCHVISYSLNSEQSTGLSAIGVEESYSETFYTLDGRIVDADNLTPGIYIKVCNGRSSKFIVR